MRDLGFEILSAKAEKYAATPSLAFQLQITNPQTDQPIQSILLHSQIQIEAVRRKYSPAEQQKLKDLFGEPERWGDTLRTTYWTSLSQNVPGFEESRIVNLIVPCTFDFNIAATKYFAGLEDGEVPLSFLFSGTVFHKTDEGLQVGQISWNQEAKFRLPINAWQDMMDHYYPNGVWLRLRRDVFDHVNQYKIDRGIPTWELVMEHLLKLAGEGISKAGTQTPPSTDRNGGITPRPSFLP